MTPDTITQPVLRFIREHIDSVPHLEGLLLLRESAPKVWSAEELAARLYVNAETGRRIVTDLTRRRLIVASTAGVAYNPDNEYAELLPEVAQTYSRQLVQVARFIHAKGSPAMQEFARAFKLKKDED